MSLPDTLLAPSTPESAAGFPAEHEGDAFRMQLREATAFLTRIAENRALLVEVPAEERQRLLDAVAVVFHPDPKARRGMVKATTRLRKEAAARRDDDVLQETGIRELRRRPVFTTPNYYLPASATSNHNIDGQQGSDAVSQVIAEAVVPQHCYICKAKFTAIHHFYDQMCGDCAAFNYAKRTELADLSGRTALLTGGRVKIGYQAGLKLLRCGARLLVTTRFPRDSAMRYAAEPDFADWKHRLEIFGLDMRHTPSVEAFCRELLHTESRLDFIINNACQTVRRPPAFYAHLMEGEMASMHTLSPDARRVLGTYEAWRDAQRAIGAAPLDEERSTPRVQDPAAGLARAIGVTAIGATAIGVTQSAALSQVQLLPEDVVEHSLFPEGKLDQDLQQVDLRDRNSWRLQLDEVPSVELLEVQLVNAVAPFILNARLKPLMLRTDNRDKHVVNVSAMEGQFYRNNKTTRHPHTNMAKAALNMMTRTSAADYQQDGIHMNSVDTGWVTDEDVADIAARKVANHRFHPPLDIVDGAARIVDPIIAGVNTAEHVWGMFLKDYKSTEW